METKFDYLHQHMNLKCKGNEEIFSKIIFFSLNVINIFSFIVFYFGFGEVIHFVLFCLLSLFLGR